MRYRYTAPMDMRLFRLILDAMLAYIAKSENEKQSLRDMVAERDKIIAGFQAQIATASTMLVVEESDLKSVHERLAELASILLPDN